MATFSVRCRHQACRLRQVFKRHPDEYKRVKKCPSCGNTKGWRVEDRAYNKRGLCHCSGPDVIATGGGKHFPHRTTHPLCDQHPHGFYSQARAQGIAHEDIPTRYWPMSDYNQLLAKCDKLQEVVDQTHELVENLLAAGRLPLPDDLRVKALTESLEALRESLAPHIDYEPLG